jgi:hypothetical protein
MVGNPFILALTFYPSALIAAILAIPFRALAAF